MIKRIGEHKVPRLRTYFREWRKWAGLTQEELAQLVGCAEGTISRYESGERDFTGKFLAIFVEIIGCPNPGDPISRPPDTLSADRALGREPSERQAYIRRRAAELEAMFKTPSKK